MKKLIVSVIIGVFCGAVLFAQIPKDGFYFAQDANFTNNMKNQVVIEVSGGKISSVKINIVFLQAGSRDLKAMAAMADAAPAMKTLATQVAAVEEAIVKANSTNARNVQVSGGPPNAAALITLANNALTARNVQPVAKGSISKDGWLFAEMSEEKYASFPREEQDNKLYHTRDTVLVTVVNGTIVDVLWNGVLMGMHPSVNPSKMITSRANGYPMNDTPPAGIARAPRNGSRWDQQSEKVAAELVKVQNPASIKARPDGYTDAISGVSIHVSDFIELAKQALAQ